MNTTSTHRRQRLATLAGLTLLLSACGGGDGATPAAGAAAPPPAAGTPSPPAPTNNGGASSLGFAGPSLATPLPLAKMVINDTRTLALKTDGTVYTWGITNTLGALGDGNAVNAGNGGIKQEQKLPVRATALESSASPVVDIAIGWYASFALRADGSLWAVGSNTVGELGRTASTASAINPAQRIGGTYTKVVSNYTRTYAIGTNQALYWWGEGLSGPQTLIAANVVNVWNGPVGIDPLDSRAVLHGGYALLVDGTVMAWGDNARGAFGNGNTVRSLTPVTVALPKTGVRDMVPGVAVMADGALYLWGANAANTARFYKDPDTGQRVPIGLTPTKVAGGYAAVNLTADGRVVRLDLVTDTDGVLVLTPKVAASNVARHFQQSSGLCNAIEGCALAGLRQDLSAVVATAGQVRIRTTGSSYANVATGGVFTVDADNYVNSVFDAAFTAPPPPPATGTGSGTGGGGQDTDALNNPLVNYRFTCSATQEVKTVQVSNGPCLSTQQSYTKATSCNEVGSDFTFNAVGKPFYQCLVNNSTGVYKTNYQQYLKFYGG